MADTAGASPLARKRTVTERKAITRAELASVAAGLRRLLDAIAAGELSAPAGTVTFCTVSRQM